MGQGLDAPGGRRVGMGWVVQVRNAISASAAEGRRENG